MKIYVIDKKVTSGWGTSYYKYRSLFNNNEGIWHHSEKEAIEEGEKHQKIISKIYNRDF